MKKKEKERKELFLLDNIVVSQQASKQGRTREKNSKKLNQ